MIDYDIERARSAVQYLVDTPYFSHRVKGLRSVVNKPRATPFKDDAEVLNELLVIGRQNEQAMENLIAVAAQKRDTRNDYQREFMRQKRARQKMYIQILELDLGRKLMPDERYQKLLKQSAIWDAEKEPFIEARCNRMINNGGVPTGEDRYAFTREFWAQVDESLQLRLTNMRNAKDRKKRMQVVHNPAVKTAFQKAIDKHK